ncbi:putative ribonuclease H-like domain-containing protein [Tanacetum coccineum]|uniref:Ribonuclease H-like domain-containing protein n=1 Tax=Tanacetum coccineum TaxID=301880 RepID=A0ABQ4XYB7_9ASTR
MMFFLVKKLQFLKEVACKDYEINVLKSEFEKVKQEKKGIEFKIEKFDKASKDLDKLLGSQITDKSKKGLGYSAVPPPHPLIYNRPKKLDLSYSGLDEFKEPEFKGYGSENSKQESNIVCDQKSDDSKENSNDSLVKEQVSKDTSSFVESSLNVDKETVFPVDKKVESVKPKNHEKPVKKSVRYAEMYRSQTPRGNQRNWNGQKSNQLGSDFVMYNKACFICGSFNHVQAQCKYHQRERMVYGNNYNRVNYNYTTKRTHPNAQRNMVPRAVLMKTGLKPFNTARTVNTAHPKSTVFSAKPMSCFPKTAQSTVLLGFFFLAINDETSEILKNFIKEIENLVDKKVKIIRSDNGTEFKNKVMDDFCREKADSKLPTTFWAEAVSTACYVQNRVLVVKPHNKTPYELFRGFKPALSFMRPFGCHVTILNTLDNLGKFDGKSDEGFFVGYSLSSKAFRVYNTRTRRVEENLHIGFLENKPMIEGNGPKWLFDIDSLTQSMNYVPVAAGTITNESAGTQGELNAGTSTQKEEISQDCIVMPIWKDASYFDSPSKDVGNGEPKSAADDQKQHVNTASPKVNTGHFKLNTIDPSVNTASSSDPDSPKDMITMGASHTLEATHVEFFSDEDEPEVDLGNILNSYTVPTTSNTRIHKDHSIKNMIGDVKSSVQTKRMTKPTSEQGLNPQALLKLYLIHLRWKQCRKNFCNSNSNRNKARLVAQGPRQEEGIDYEEVFAPVARIKAIRLFLAYASFVGFLVYQMDVKSAFLYETIEEEVYVTQPPGFKDPDYLDKVYKVYVDDIIFGSTNKELCTAFEKLMKDKFQMCSTGELTFFLGLQVIQKEDGIFISQDKYIAKILKKFNYTDVKSASTPVDLEKPLVKDGDVDDVDVYLYRSMIRYLKGKPTLGLWYSRDSPFELVAYTDSDYAGATQDRKSTTGGCQFLGNRLISWQCKKQTVVATSTTEAEYDKHIEYLMLKASPLKSCLRRGYLCQYAVKHVGSTCNIKNVLKESKTSRHVKRGRDTKIPQSSGLLVKVGDEAVHKELGDKMERDATTASSLEAEQDSDAQTRFETTFKQSNDPPLTRVNTLGSGEDNMKLMELMSHCTTLSELQTAALSTNEDGVRGITATIDRKVKVFISESSIRRHLKLEDSDGISSLPTVEIFEQLALMGPKKIAWEQFSSNIATAIIFLATNRTFNFSNFILEAMVKNLDSKSKFLMYLIFIQIFLNKCKRILFRHKRTFLTPTLTQKRFSNMKRASKGYFGVDIPLFLTMLTTPESSPSRITSLSSLSPQTHPSTSQPPSTLQSNQTTPVTEEAALIPHESPLQSVHLLGRDECSLSLNELTVLCTLPSKKVESLESELKQTKQTYHAALTKLIKRVKKLEQTIKISQARRKAKVVISDAEEDEEDPSKQGRSFIEELDLDAGISLVFLVTTALADATRRRQSVENFHTYTRRSRLVSTVDVRTASELGSTAGVKAKDKGKAIMQESEPPKKIKKRVQVQMSVDEELSKKVFEEEQAKFKAEQEQEKFDFETALELQKQLDEREEVGGYKLSHFKGMSYEDIRPIFERVWDQNQAFVSKDSEIEKEVMKRSIFDLQQEFVIKDEASSFTQKQPARGSRKKSLARKRARETLCEESAKKQKLEDDTEKEELQVYLNIVPEEESLNIESWQQNGSVKHYKIFSAMLYDFDRQDVLELYRFVKEIFQTESPEGYDLLLWGDLKTMIEPNEEDKIWRNQQDWNLINWKLHNFCGVHVLLIDTGFVIHMMVEKKYPLSQDTLSKMLSRRLEVDHQSAMGYELISAKTTSWNEFSSTMASAIIFFLEKQVENMSKHIGVYVTPSHTKNVFSNMKRPCKGFSGRSPLFSTMIVQAAKDMGADLATPTDFHSTPIITQPSSSKPQKKKTKRKQRKDSAPTEPTTEETTPEEHVSTHSYDPPPSGEDRMQLDKLMSLCTNLQEKVLDLEKAKSAQAKEITSLKKRVRKVTLVNETQEMNDDNLMFDTSVLEEQEIKFEKVVEEPVVSVATSTKSIPVRTAEVVTTRPSSQELKIPEN